MITIAQLSPDCWQQYKTIRLEALQSDRTAFGAAYEGELAFEEATWRQRIGVMWFALVEGKPVGMIGWVPGATSFTKHKAQVVSFWVQPASRGQGVGTMLLGELQRQAPVRGYKKLFLDVTVEQAAAIALYKKHGFRTVGILKKELFVDGRYLDQYAMEWLAEE